MHNMQLVCKICKICNIEYAKYAKFVNGTYETDPRFCIMCLKRPSGSPVEGSGRLNL